MVHGLCLSQHTWCGFWMPEFRVGIVKNIGAWDWTCCCVFCSGRRLHWGPLTGSVPRVSVQKDILCWGKTIFDYRFNQYVACVSSVYFVFFSFMYFECLFCISLLSYICSQRTKCGSLMRAFIRSRGCSMGICRLSNGTARSWTTFSTSIIGNSVSSNHV